MTDSNLPACPDCKSAMVPLSGTNDGGKFALHFAAWACVNHGCRYIVQSTDAEIGATYSRSKADIAAEMYEGDGFYVESEV
jgi:hypothetical protein